MRRSRTSGLKPLSRTAVISSSDVEIYTPERLAEFFLNNAIDKQDYLEARKEMESTEIDPDSIPHRRWPS